MIPVVLDGDQGRGRLLTSAFIALTLSDLAYFTAIGVMIPVVPLFASDRLGVGAVGVGVAIGLFSMIALVLRPFAGRLSDQWGSGWLFLSGAVLFTVAAAAHLLVTEYWSLLLLRVVLGVADAMFVVAGVAAMGDMAPPDRLGEALSYNSLGLYIGIAAGPALGEWLLRVGGFRAAWIGVLCLGAMAALFATRVPSMRQSVDGGAKPSPLPRRLIGPGLVFLAGLASAAGFLAFAAIHARDVGLGGAGGVLFVY
ncbi:MAG: MFS transporter, partial [Longispora sp.]|nr:MFS transporter [Longispora sp. (in: high G+C Gram-positive bacteria)]